MFTSRYSESEMQQWHDACSTDSQAARNDAPRHEGARALMAKGQADRKQSFATTSAVPAQSPQEPWASECLFDCYNG